jgi:hypothetical protein
VLVGWKARNGSIKAGWSLCHKNDEFDPKTGLIFAKKQATTLDQIDPVPQSIKKKVEKFADRLLHYYTPAVHWEVDIGTVKEDNS